MKQGYELRLCQADELDKLLTFIDSSWKKNHILSKYLPLLNFQYFDATQSVYNFLVAYNQRTQNFDAILGFIPTAQYDKTLLLEKDFWLAIWKVEEKYAEEKALGLKLLLLFFKKYAPRSVGIIGVSNIAEQIYSRLSFRHGVLAQYFRVNTTLKKHSLISGSFCHKVEMENNNARFMKIDNLETVDELEHHYIPKKTKNFMINRYAKHPIYKYAFYGLYLYDHLKTIFVIRKIQNQFGSCLRIVDLLGALIPVNLASAFDDLLSNENAEYIDCLNYGINEEIFYKMGFAKRNESVTIPEYFEPFIKKNIDIKFAYKLNKSTFPYVFFKGDSDQDRPNILP